MAKYSGLDLPIYGPEVQVLYTKHELWNATSNPESTFVRRVRIEALGCSSLAEVLTVADGAFKWLCDRAQADVVGHKWGLQRLDPANACHNSRTYKPCPLVPEDYILVAEVDTIRDIHELTDVQFKAIQKARLEYREYINGLNGPTWQEDYYYQFRNGHYDATPTIRLIMPDIEPVLI